MSLKLKALLQAVGIFALSIVFGIIASTAISKIPAEAIPWIFMTGLAAVAINLLYTVRLSRLEYKNSLEKLNETSKKS